MYNRKSPQHSRLIPGICILAVFILLLAFFLLRGLSDLFSEKIRDDISICQVEVGGMRKSQAIRAVNDAIGSCIRKNDMVVALSDTSLRLSPKESGVSLDTEAIVNQTIQSQQSITDLRPYLHVNEEYIRNVLAEYADQLSEGYAPASFSLQGMVPALDEQSFDENVACPALILNTGSVGFGLDTDALYLHILDAYASGNLQIDGQDLIFQKEPDMLNLEEIQNQVAILPVNASLDAQSKTVIPGSYGIGFDLEEATARLKKAAYGETLQIPMSYLTPDIMGQEAYFHDVLGFCQTPHSNNENRNSNLRLACSALNGVVLQPGEVLSYNATLGKRTEEKGYMPAPAYSGTELVDSIGGGICQVSSTLYLCSLYAGLDTVERISHGYPVHYIPIGLDATVSWGSPDLKVSNPYEYPVKLVAEEQDGFVRVWIMGTEVRDYYIRMGFTSSGDGYAKSYICKYDSKTDEQLSREYHRLSSYFSETVAMIGEIGSNQSYVNGLPREQDPCSPTPETLAASRQYHAPNTNG